MGDRTPNYIPGHQGFNNTRWTMLEVAADPEASGQTVAMEFLATQYWNPVYAFLRASGKSVEDAQDLTQGFFSYFFENGIARRADKNRGRFRTFLLQNVKFYVSNEWQKSQAKKRGGGLQHLPFEELADEEHFLKTTCGSNPEKDYDRCWARSLNARVRERLAAYYEQQGKKDLYEALQKLGRYGSMSGNEIAEKFDMSVSAVKKAGHDMRRRHARMTREEVANTVQAEADVDEEIRYLLSLV